MPSNNATSDTHDTDVDLIEITTRNNAIYAIDHTTGDGCHGSTRGEALYNLGCKLERKKNRNPASKDDGETLLDTE